MNTSDFCMYGGCWSTYIHKRPSSHWVPHSCGLVLHLSKKLSKLIHKRPNIGNALRGFFTGVQSEKDGSNKTRTLSHMSLGVISTKQRCSALID